MIDIRFIAGLVVLSCACGRAYRGHPYGLAVDEHSAYVFDAGASPGYVCSLLKVDQQTDVASTLARYVNAPNCGGPITVAGKSLIYVQPGALGVVPQLVQVSTGGSTPRVIASPSHALDGIVSDFVATSSFVYWLFGYQDGNSNAVQDVLRTSLSDYATATLITAEPDWGEIAVDDAFVYFSTKADIRRVPLSGGATEKLFDVTQTAVANNALPGALGIYTVVSISVDDTHLAWAEQEFSVDAPDGVSLLRIATKNGGEPETLLANLYDVGRVVLDSGFLYYSAGGGPTGNTLAKIPVAGGDPQPYAVTGPIGPLALTPSKIFWLDSATVRSLPR